jgi:hypothetical protein
VDFDRRVSQLLELRGVHHDEVDVGADQLRNATLERALNRLGLLNLFRTVHRPAGCAGGMASASVFMVSACSQAGQVVEVGDGAKAEHDVVVCQFVMVTVKTMGDDHLLAVDIHTVHFPGKEIHPLEQLAHGVHKMQRGLGVQRIIPPLPVTLERNFASNLKADYILGRNEVGLIV